MLSRTVSAVVTCVAWATAFGQAADSKDREQERIKLRTLGFTIQREHKLQSADLHFIKEQLASPVALNRAFALFVLEEAVDAKAFLRKDLLALIEQKTSAAIGLASATYVQAYRSALKIKSPDKVFAMKFQVLAKMKKEPGKLDLDEKTFTMALLRNGKPENRMFAGTILAVKMGLDKVSLKWAAGQIDPQISKSKGDEKLYWQFIGRVVKTGHNSGFKS